MLNLRKTKKLEILGNDDQMRYGTKKDPKKDIKKDQKKYEEKVNQFLRYCKNFRNELVERSKNKDKRKELKTVGDIKECFDSSFKEYYKKSKKFSLFSRTTKVLKGMDKQLDKIKKVELAEDAAQKIKDAFKYTSKRNDEEYGKRSAIDDKAVYGFFNLTLPKIINNICQKARGEQADELKELNDLMDFVNESFGKVKRLSIKVGERLESIKDEVEEQEDDIDGIQEKNKDLQQKAEESDGQKDKKTINEMKDEIAVLEGKNKENNDKIKELLGKYNDAKNLYIELLPFSNTNEWRGDEEKKKSLSMLLFGEKNKSENVNLLLQGLDTKAGELKDKLEGMANEVKKLKGDIEDNTKKIKEIEEEQKNMGNKLNAIK